MCGSRMEDADDCKRAKGVVEFLEASGSGRKTLASPESLSQSFVLQHRQLSKGPVDSSTFFAADGLACPVHEDDTLLLLRVLEHRGTGNVTESERMVIYRKESKVMMFRSLPAPDGGRIIIRVQKIPTLAEPTKLTFFHVQGPGAVWDQQTQQELVIDCRFCSMRGEDCQCSPAMRDRSGKDALSRVQYLANRLPMLQVFQKLWFVSSSVGEIRAIGNKQGIRARFEVNMDEAMVSKMRAIVVQNQLSSHLTLSPSVPKKVDDILANGAGKIVTYLESRSSISSHSGGEGVGTSSSDGNALPLLEEEEGKEPPTSKARKGERRKLSCSVCGREFFQRGHLNIHIKVVHEKIRRYACGICGNAFSTRFNLTRHTRVVHGDE